MAWVKQNWRSWFAYAALFSAGGLFVCVALFAPHLAQAQTDLETFATTSGLSTQPLPVLVARIVRTVLGTIGVITVCIVLYGGYLYLLSGGEPAKIDKAKSLLKNAAIGLVIIFASYSITSYILNRLLEAAGRGGVTSSAAQQYIEPLSGSLGRGVVNDHYPPRNATDIARNTNIMITFNEPISPASMMSNYVEGAATGYLNVDNVLIYPVSEMGTCSNDVLVDCADDGDCAAAGAGSCTFTSGEEKALMSENVIVAVNDDFTIYTFNPVELLGNSLTDTNYVVNLGTDILTYGRDDAFTGAYDDGYEWTFEVSTVVDLTPPYVVSVAPVPSTIPYERNITVQLTFSEAMDPVAATGIYQPEGKNFTHIEIADKAATDNVEGTYSISNGYKTVEFTTFDACGKDPCGDTIYCLPGSATIEVLAHAATLTAVPDEIPQGRITNGSYDGLVDAAGNTLDGDNDWDTETGEAGDDYQFTPPTPGWTFGTSASVNMTPPKILSMTPSLGSAQSKVALNAPVTFTFADSLLSLSVNSQNVILLPDPEHVLAFWSTYADATKTVTVNHGSFLPTIETQQYYYWPILTHGVKSAYQICMFPANGPSTDCDGTNTDSPLCCTGDATTKTGAATDVDCTFKSAATPTPVYTFPEE